MPSAFRLVAITPSGLPDASLAIAASRAGELGVLDLEYTDDARAALDAVAKLAQHARNEFGIKVAGDERGMLAEVVSSLPEGLRVVILTPSDPNRLQAQVEMLRHLGVRAILEATCLEEALAGEEAGADGVIAKGHEAGGRVGEQTSFILLQQFLARLKLPIWVHGGIGLHTAAACYVAGAAGVVLDSQLLLARESPLPNTVKAKIGIMDGSETACLGSSLGEVCRVYAQPGASTVIELRELEAALSDAGRPQAETIAEWRTALRQRVGWDSTDRSVLLLGQDATLAASLAKRFRTVGGILDGMWKAIEDHCQMARTFCPLEEGSPLARSHGTRYPIVQGPMTRVSDNAEFALQVAENGALPFLGLGLMRGQEVKTLLEETRSQLGDRPWGIGILGFAPAEILQEQLAVIRAWPPPFALIAGGRPDQARVLEQEGVPCYFHVPSPGLLKLFLQEGARAFVFEGRECGGHVGPRSSFVLWETLVDVLLEWLDQNNGDSSCQVLFAGGIHDALSSSMVATIAAPLVERDVRVGVLLGTAYLFTEEAVDAGAICKCYQHEAVHCSQTVLLESGPGHSTRVADTPYVKSFEQKKRELLRAGVPTEETRDILEDMNVGRLRIASKGLARNPLFGREAGAPEFTQVNEREQRLQGTYMIGQVATLRDRICSIATLHHEVAAEGSQRLRSLPADAGRNQRRPSIKPSAIAIIGMGCILPGAPDLQTFWENILNKVDCIREVPGERWDWKAYYDPDPKAKDKMYSKWGGFLDDVPFDPVSYGMPPNSLPSIEPVHLLALEVVRAALKDAGYSERAPDREHISIILGAGGGAGDVAVGYIVRSALPMLFGDTASEIVSGLEGILPEWTDDSFPGVLMNVAAGRAANRFDFGGVNCTVDAACASSLAAVHIAVNELDGHGSDVVVVGGIDALQNPFSYVCFSKTRTLSPSGRSSPYDAKADGIIIGEGVAALVLKRLSDAERDGDRIYGVIRGVGASSDGRSKGLVAPHPEGQIRALQRAYAKANIPPATVGLIEGHGTGTVAGDQAEVTALTQFFNSAGDEHQRCALGSVKSMIGHTKSTAGAAGLIKVALALHHKVLPPTLNCDEPNPKLSLEKTPLYVNTETRPWIHDSGDAPRRAGVSSFGFGGTNFHVVVEEYAGDYVDNRPLPAPLQEWPSELFVWRAPSRETLLEMIIPIEKALAGGARPSLRDLAWTLSKEASNVGDGKLCLAIVATSLDDLRQKLGRAGETLADPTQLRLDDPRGTYFAAEPLSFEGKIAFLFPGQGSQYVNMLGDLAIQFPEVRTCFERADKALRERMPESLSSYVFPPPTFTEAEERANEEALTQTNVAQPALGAADLAMLRLLESLGVEASYMGGHSYGEFVGLCAGGVFSEDDLFAVSEARGRFIIEESGPDSGTMAAVAADRETVAALLEEISGDVVIANLNSPQQTVVSGEQELIDQVVQQCEVCEIRATRIPVSCAFHSPLVARSQARLAEFLSTIKFAPPRVEVFSNTTGAPYPHEPEAILELLAQHLIRPVNFLEEINAMYGAGARIFVEVGPRNVLTRLVDTILGERPHLTVASDQRGRHNLVQLHHLLAQLAAHGVPVRLDRLYEGRPVRELDLRALDKETGEEPLPPTTWLVNGGRARPLSEAMAEKSAPKAHRPLHVNVPQSGATEALVPATQEPPEPAISSHGANRPAAPLSEAGLPVARAPVHSDGLVGEVVTQFQHLMSRFLDVQKDTMLTYLQGASGDGALVHDYPASVAEAEPPALSAPATHVRPTDDSEIEAAEDLLNEEALAMRLVAIASERTGYPPQMIDLDADLEADLGIDSIKRVEILGILKQSFAQPEQLGVDLEKLSASKTLRAIIDSILASPDRRHEVQDTTAAPSCVRGISERAYEPHYEVTPQEEEAIQRFTLRVTETPLAAHARAPLSDRVLVLTDDQTGVAHSLANALSDQGCTVALVRTGSNVEEVEPGCYTGDLVSPQQVAQLVETIRQRQGPIGGLAHLLPLKQGLAFDEMDLAAWKERIQLDVKSLFLLSKALAAELEAAAGEGGGFLVAATSMGGAFGSDDATGPFFPGQGGVAGFAKTLALEWPEVRVKAIDLNPQEPVDVIAGHVLAEIMADDSQVEVGYDGSRRLILQPELAPVKQTEPPELAIDSSWVILVTGGARGITAEVARDLAERYRPTLLLVGSSPFPGAEDEETAGLNDPQQLKAVLIERMGRDGERVVPARVEEAYHRLLREREIRRNLAELERTGTRIRYYQADVRDEEAFGAIIDEIYSTYGSLDGVIHGAGIIDDKLVKDKTTDSFDRVFGIKAESVFILSRRLRPESLKFLVLFSSVSGRFGNRGQGDYAAASEVLNKVAVHLDRQWPGRIMSINWGPWMKGGMVSPEVQRQFDQRGIALIPPEVGRRRMDEELRHGRKGQVEVLIGGGWVAATPEGGDWPIAATLPLLAEKATLSRTATGVVEVCYPLDPARDLYLRDHCLDGRPVLPVAMAMELMAEAVLAGWPGFKVVGVRGLRVLRGIVVEEGLGPIRVVTKEHTPHSEEERTVEAAIVDSDGAGRLHYRATVDLRKYPTSSPSVQPTELQGAAPFPMSVEQAYRDLLFHGPLLQGIEHIEAAGPTGLSAILKPSSPQACLAGRSGDAWLLDPIVIDCALQLQVLWGRIHWDITSLPFGIEAYRQFAPLAGPYIRCEMRVRPNTAAPVIYADHYFFAADGQLLGILEGVEIVGSQGLNRVTGDHLRRAGSE